MLRSVKITGAPALDVVGPSAAIMSVRRLTSLPVIQITDISNAVKSPTTTIFKWVERSTVYIEQFTALSKCALVGLGSDVHQQR